MNLARKDRTSSLSSSSSSRRFLMPGQVIAKRYRVIRPLGQGGMASVYLVEDLVLGEKEVAIKVLQSPANDDAGLSDRFIREVRLTHRIQHENVVRTFDFGRDEQLLYYTMEYQRGAPLDTVLRGKPLPISVVMRMAWQLFRGAVAIHSVGVVHRDIKPSNLILNDQGVLKITDFGVARLNSAPATVAAGDILGTVLYIAPEVLQGAIPSRAVDFYAIGVVLYEALTGRVPFAESNPARLIVRKIDETPLAVRELRPEVPGWLADGVDGLLSADPEARMRTVHTLVARLDSERGAPQSGLLQDDLLASKPAPEVGRKGWIRGALERLATRLSRIPLLVAILSGLLLIPVSQLELASHLERLNIDTLFRARGERQPHSDLLVVAMDEQSYRNLGVPLNTAWPRRLHAELLHALADAGARRVVFDIIFSGADEANADDRALAEAMKRVPTVLGAALGLSQRATINGAFMLEELIQPELMFESQGVGIGVVGLPQRAGRIGGFFESTSDVFPNLRSLAEMAVALDRRPASSNPDARSLINFYGAKGAIPTVPYEMIVGANGLRVPAEVVRDKVVFVGLALRSSTGPSQRDSFITPFDSATFGTEVHATAAANLLADDWIRRTSGTQQLLVSVVLAVVSAALVAASRGRSGVVRGVVALLGAAAIEYALFSCGWFVSLFAGVAWGVTCGGLLRFWAKPWGDAVVSRRGLVFYALSLVLFSPIEAVLAAPASGEPLTASISAPVRGSEFGAGLSCTRQLVAVGAPSEGGGIGAAYLFNPVQLEGALLRVAAPAVGDIARFGASVQFIGDLNGDGVAELVVGAPGDSLNGIGGNVIAFLSQVRDAELNFESCAILAAEQGVGSTIELAADAEELGSVSLVVGGGAERPSRSIRVSLRSDSGCELRDLGQVSVARSGQPVCSLVASNREALTFIGAPSEDTVYRFKTEVGEVSSVTTLGQHESTTPPSSQAMLGAYDGGLDSGQLVTATPTPLIPTPQPTQTARPPDGVDNRPTDVLPTPGQTPSHTPTVEAVKVAPGQSGLPAPQVIAQQRQVTVVMPGVSAALSKGQRREAIRLVARRGGVSLSKAARLVDDPTQLSLTYIVSLSPITSRGSNSLISAAYADQPSGRAGQSSLRRIRSKSQRVTIARLTPGVNYVTWYQVEIALKKPRVVLGTTKASRTRRFATR